MVVAMAMKATIPANRASSAPQAPSQGKAPAAVWEPAKPLTIYCRMRATELQDLLKRTRDGLRAVYGERLHAVWLHGSRATGEATEDSDIDVLVVLDRVERYWDEIKRTSRLVSEMSLEAQATLNVSFVSRDAWEGQASTFLQHVRETGVAA
jgi:uncharacterized protein